MIGNKRTKLSPSQTAYLLQNWVSSITAVIDIKRVIKTMLGLTVFILYAFTFSPILYIYKESILL